MSRMRRGNGGKDVNVPAVATLTLVKTTMLTLMLIDSFRSLRRIWIKPSGRGMVGMLLMRMRAR
jgi:hypothetical protein